MIRLHYRCRLCSEVFLILPDGMEDTSSVSAALDAIYRKQPGVTMGVAPIIHAHACREPVNSTGIADLIGCENYSLNREVFSLMTGNNLPTGNTCLPAQNAGSFPKV